MTSECRGQCGLRCSDCSGTKHWHQNLHLQTPKHKKSVCLCLCNVPVIIHVCPHLFFIRLIVVNADSERMRHLSLRHKHKVIHTNIQIHTRTQMISAAPPAQRETHRCMDRAFKAPSSRQKVFDSRGLSAVVILLVKCFRDELLIPVGFVDVLQQQTQDWWLIGWDPSASTFLWPLLQYLPE